MEHFFYCPRSGERVVYSFNTKGCEASEGHQGTNTLNTTKDKNERRSSDRFPIERDVRYRILNRKTGDEVGAGRTLNMSSNGVLFTTEGFLIPGRRVELSVSWPAQLNSRVALKLVARGRVIRAEDGVAAVEIQQYEFRTQGSQIAAAGQ